MTETKKVIVRRTPKPKTAEVVDNARQFFALKKQETVIKNRLDELRERLSTAVDLLGAEDERGSKFFEFEEPVDEYQALKWEKRSGSKAMNLERAEKFLKKRRLYEKCLVPVLDEDKIAELFYRKQITEKEYDALIDQGKDTWRLLPIKS